jgi:hypothetical protein
LAQALACAALVFLPIRSARADLGDDLRAVRSAWAGQARVDASPIRLLERGEAIPVVMPAWALDPKVGNCTTLLLLAPAPTQFLVRVHPYRDLQSQFASRAGALQISRCGEERLSLLRIEVEMRSPRAALHTLVAVGSDDPPELAAVLPQREAGPSAPDGDPGPRAPREPVGPRLARLAQAAQNEGATEVRTLELAEGSRLSLELAPGCHRLFATTSQLGALRTLVMVGQDGEPSDRLLASELGDVATEICVVQRRQLSLAPETRGPAASTQLSVASFPLPQGLPARFGPGLNERLAQALGASRAAHKLGPLVVASFGAQGRTLLPRRLLPHTCYLAAVVVLHGVPQELSLGVRAGPHDFEAQALPSQPGAHLGFCTDWRGQAELDVEARGLGLSWLYLLFQMGPARPEGE